MQKSSTMRRTASKIFKERQLTIGVDLGDRWSFYCVLDESREGKSGGEGHTRQAAGVGEGEL